MNKNTIIRNFSKYAAIYDNYADIQKLSALKLAERAGKQNFNNILEIGCGSGNYTLLLADKFKGARLKALDISEEMIAAAKVKLKERLVEFIVVDAESINLDEKFDLITSNACFQWFENLEAALKKYKNFLNKNGEVSFSIFGPQTYYELNESLKDISGGVSIEAANFVAKKEIKKILNANFREFAVSEVKYEETFIRLKELLEKIRYSGGNGQGVNGKFFFGPEGFKKLEEVYLNKFNNIRATYQIFYCWGLN